MKGYIYTMYKGADPGKGWSLTDPVFSPVPSMGACMPNIRRLVQQGDHIFAISGRVSKVRQYVVGGMSVGEKIDMREAYRRYPALRQVQTKDGTLRGNIIVGPDGTQVDTDYHDNFENRLDNFIVGSDPVQVQTPGAVEIARSETISVLQELFKRRGDTVHKVMGRWRRLDSGQIQYLREWIGDVNSRGSRL